MELELGYPLFDRKTREVSLTAAGSAFVIEARHALEQAERAVARGRAENDRAGGSVSLGFNPFFDQYSLLGLEEALGQLVPPLRLTTKSLFGPAQVPLILNGRLDAGIVELPMQVPDLWGIPLWEHRLSVALPTGHRMCSDRAIEISDLESESIICYSEIAMVLEAYQGVQRAYGQLGLLPRIIRHVSSTAEALDLVAAGVGIAFVRDFVTERLQYRGVAIRPVTLPGFVVVSGIAYRANNQGDNLRRLLEVVNNEAASLRPVRSNEGMPKRRSERGDAG